MTLFPAPGFTGSPLIRFDHERDNHEWFQDQLAHPSARLLRLDGLTPDVEDGGFLAWVPMTDADPGTPLALLGTIGGEPRFVALNRIKENGAQRSAIMNTLLAHLRPEEAATYAIARCLVDWHNRHMFCANCGRATKPFKSGWVRLCDREADGCGTEHFPRTDPVVIMLAEYGDHVLLGRQRMWPPGRYSALAGFVEVGESIEEAVARELHEESGIVASEVRYIVSQPWPFPSQMMIACIAKTESDAINLDADEIEEAIWVNRDEVAAALRGDADAKFLPPPPFAIANTLLTRWVSGA